MIDGTQHHQTTPQLAVRLECPSWCATDHTSEDDRYALRLHGIAQHTKTTADLRLHALTDRAGHTVRAATTDVMVGLVQDVHYDYALGSFVSVDVTDGPLSDSHVTLTPAECRSLAAMLLNAADELEPQGSSPAPSAPSQVAADIGAARTRLFNIRDLVDSLDEALCDLSRGARADATGKPAS